MNAMTTGPAGAWTGHPVPARHPADRFPVALVVLWLTTAVLLVVAPFPTWYTHSWDDADDAESTRFNGWGQVNPDSDVGAHDTRLGVVLVLAAVLFAVAAMATAACRRSSWAGHLGMLGGGIAVTAGAFQATHAHATLGEEDSGEQGSATLDITLGPGFLLAVIAVVLAAAIVVLSWRRVRALARWTAPACPWPTHHGPGRLPYVLAGLWLALAAVFALAPFLTFATVVETSPDEVTYEYLFDGWGRYGGDAADSSGHGLRFGVLCAVVAAVLVVALVAVLVRPAATWTIRFGLLATGMCFATGLLQALRTDANLSGETDGVDVSVGAGAGLLMVSTALAVAAMVLALVRLHRLRA